MNEFDIVVVGGGHAGCEAALVAARAGCKTALVTLVPEKIASMPCNPSIGGIAKSHLICEIDAMGGEMGYNADMNGLQYRMLNTKRGPAVQATRIQCDKPAYSAKMRDTMREIKNLTIIGDEVISILFDGTRAMGVATLKNGEIKAKRTILTAGTFLRGTIHIGHETVSGGGNGQPAANFLADQLRNSGLTVARLKTGTPPRFKPSSINYQAVNRQEGDVPPPVFSWKTRKMFHMEHNVKENDKEKIQDKDVLGSEIGVIPEKVFHVEQQRPCFISHTTPETHKIIRDNLHASALYGGDITGIGARYCPSIEDKVVKFPERDSHHVFLEPESADPSLDLVYPNGLSCSLPRDIQEKMVHSVPGLENAEITAYAYAIEYDFYDPRDLAFTLESRIIPGLFMAGQINGTTGYEEAAAQGFMAGANAVMSLRDDHEFVLGRSDGYTGILIDDLVTKGTNEPYRMFTSRAEHRLILRQDNSRFRMLPWTKRLGIVDPLYIDETESMIKRIKQELCRLNAERLHGQTLATHLCKVGVKYSDLPGALPLDEETIFQIEIQTRYRGYIEREEHLAEQSRKQEKMIIPEWINYADIRTLRFETREKLSRARPVNLGQASRISGITPADIAILSVVIKRGCDSVK